MGLGIHAFVSSLSNDDLQKNMESGAFRINGVWKKALGKSCHVNSGCQKGKKEKEAWAKTVTKSDFLFTYSRTYLRSFNMQQIHFVDTPSRALLRREIDFSHLFIIFYDYGFHLLPSSLELAFNSSKWAVCYLIPAECHFLEAKRKLYFRGTLWGASTRFEHFGKSLMTLPRLPICGWCYARRMTC